jgi:hypothetical protein
VGEKEEEMSDVQRFHPVGLALIMLNVWLSWQSLTRGLWVPAALAFVIMFVLLTIESVASESSVIKKSRDDEFDENA